jgi:hypothetical protein
MRSRHRPSQPAVGACPAISVPGRSACSAAELSRSMADSPAGHLRTRVPCPSPTRGGLPQDSSPSIGDPNPRQQLQSFQPLHYSAVTGQVAPCADQSTECQPERRLFAIGLNGVRLPSGCNRLSELATRRGHSLDRGQCQISRHLAGMASPSTHKSRPMFPSSPPCFCCDAV